MRLRGNCGGPFDPELAALTKSVVDVDGVITMSGAQMMAGDTCIESASFTSCPNVHIDPLSPGYVGAPWLAHAIEVAGALAQEQRLADFYPDATGPLRKLVLHLMNERQRRALRK